MNSSNEPSYSNPNISAEDQPQISTSKELPTGYEQDASGVLVRRDIGNVAVSKESKNRLISSEFDSIEAFVGLIEKQAERSHRAYNEMIDVLNQKRRPDQQLSSIDRSAFDRDLAHQIYEWRDKPDSNGKIDAKALYYCMYYQNKRDGTWTLNATPNVILTPDEIFALAESFGKRLPAGTIINDEAAIRQYDNRQLSGSIKPDVTIRFSLMPSTYSTDSDTAENNLKRLGVARNGEYAEEYDKVAVPSLLEAVSYWYNLDAQLDKKPRSQEHKTRIRHINLPVKRVPRDFDNKNRLNPREHSVPISCFSYEDCAEIFMSDANDMESARFEIY